MHETLLKSGWETALVAVPFIGILLLTVFGLDGVFSAPKRTGPKRAYKERRRGSALNECNVGFYTDPDGRQWKERRAVKRPG